MINKYTNTFLKEFIFIFSKRCVHQRRCYFFLSGSQGILHELTCIHIVLDHKKDLRWDLFNLPIISRQNAQMFYVISEFDPNNWYGFVFYTPRYILWFEVQSMYYYYYYYIMMFLYIQCHCIINDGKKQVPYLTYTSCHFCEIVGSMNISIGDI